MPAFIKILLSSLLICLSQPDTVFVTDNLTGLLPDTVEGWDKSETPELYNRKNLFDYINGGAELYLAYDFHQLLVQKYVPEFEDSLGEKSITVEIWQMNSSADAYGIFSFDQEGDEIKMGQGGVYSDGFLRFWKDKFFVRILGLGKDLKEIILKLGSQIDKKIKKEGKPPELVSKIPSDSLISGSIHFFHRQIILKNLYFFSDQNVLNLDRETDCLLADFRMDKYRLKLLLIQYPDTTIAKEVEDSLKEICLQNKSSTDDNIFKTKEEKLLGMDSQGNYLILVFEGRDEKNILWLLDSTKSSLNWSKQ